ncbi:MAG: metal ABC transporter permease [Clostridia bacterium]|nr:metal ABC transporter permease [Clostridia bacterium]MBO7289197.1 metal ABC transporter permease [Clostridia bacterium]
MKEIIYLISNYDFISRAFLAGLAVSLCASLLGVTIVLRRLSMIGDGLSHISFGAMAIAAAFGFAPLKFALPSSALASLLLFRLGGRKMKGDSLIAMISSGALALGIIMISYSGSGTDMNSYLIGSLYSVSQNDLAFSLVLCGVVLICFIFFYHRIFSVTFDADFSKATGSNVGFIENLLAVLTALTVVIGMRLMGALLISSLIVFPALSAMRVFKSFKAVTLCSAIISLVSFCIGFLLTLVFDAIPTGACITVVNLIMFVLFFLLSVKKQ